MLSHSNAFSNADSSLADSWDALYIFWASFGIAFPFYNWLQLFQWYWHVPQGQWRIGEGQWIGSSHQQPPIPARHRFLIMSNKIKTIYFHINLVFDVFQFTSQKLTMIFLFWLVGSIQIRQKSQGLSLFAPSHGLQEVYVDKNTWMVIISLNSCVLPLDIFTDTHTYTQIYIAKSVQSCHQGKGWLLWKMWNIKYILICLTLFWLLHDSIRVIS